MRKQLRFGKTEKCDLKLRQKRSVYKTFVSLSFSSELCPKSRRQRQIACARAMVLIANRFRFESFVFVFLFFFGWRRQPQAASFSRPQASRLYKVQASDLLSNRKRNWRRKKRYEMSRSQDTATKRNMCHAADRIRAGCSQ